MGHVASKRIIALFRLDLDQDFAIVRKKDLAEADLVTFTMAIFR